MPHILQTLVMPNTTFGAPENMYVRICNDKAYALLGKQKLMFKEGGRVTFDTFFNSMTVGTWKKHCALDNLHLMLKGEGQFLLRFGWHRIGYANRWLEDHEIELQPGQEFLVDLNCWSQMDSGMLYFSLLALSDGNLTGGHIATTTMPAHDVKLGIVVTHFNRQEYVLNAVKRVREQLLSDPLYKGKIELIIVDNSQNLPLQDGGGITLIPNQNLGGSGGFTRGLLHLKDEKSFSHCLFMDDDASCEIESIKRTYAMLQYSTTPKFAFAGSLMRELKPYQLFEKGAIFPGVCVGLKRGLDMRYISNLLQAELMDVTPSYGAWWFFAFAIKDVSHYPFPFFVRGDDILFGNLNHFNIATLNAVGCWGEDFEFKNGPLPRYLDVRNHIIQAFVNFQLSRFACAKLITQLFISPLFSYDYASAKAARLALSHVSQGADFWVKHMGLSEVRAEIGKFAFTEKLQPINKANLKIVYLDSYQAKIMGKTELKEPGFRRFVRFVTLNGLLLPSFLIKDLIVFQHKSFRANFREVFGFKKILYEYEPMGIGYIAELDKKRILLELFKFMCQLVKFIFQFNKLKREYQKALPYMTSEEFWRGVYGQGR